MLHNFIVNKYNLRILLLKIYRSIPYALCTFLIMFDLLHLFLIKCHTPRDNQRE